MMRLQLQCSLPEHCSRVVLFSQCNCFSTVNEKKEKEEQKEKVAKEEVEDEIRSTIQSSIAM